LNVAKWNNLVSVPHLLVSLGIALLGALALSSFSGLPFWACFAIAFGALLANGWLATWEDNQPGGFNNPTDRDETNSKDQ
jgi:hypothetical protein